MNCSYECSTQVYHTVVRVKTTEMQADRGDTRFSILHGAHCFCIQILRLMTKHKLHCVGLMQGSIHLQPRLLSINFPKPIFITNSVSSHRFCSLFLLFLSLKLQVQEPEVNMFYRVTQPCQPHLLQRMIMRIFNGDCRLWFSDGTQKMWFSMVQRKWHMCWRLGISMRHRHAFQHSAVRGPVIIISISIKCHKTNLMTWITLPVQPSRGKRYMKQLWFVIFVALQRNNYKNRKSSKMV